MKHILYLASKSPTRQKLLKEVGIPFKTVQQTSDEQVPTDGLNFYDQVLAIARHKMAHVVFPTKDEIKHEVMFILTADSMVRTLHSNEIFGKPRNIEHAKYMLRAMYGNKMEVATGCCLERRRWNGEVWDIDDSKAWVTGAHVEFWVPEGELDQYLERHPEVFYSAGAGELEGSGQIYVKSIQGSYSAALGLPLFEVKEALNKLGF